MQIFVILSILCDQILNVPADFELLYRSNTIMPILSGHPDLELPCLTGVIKSSCFDLDHNEDAARILHPDKKNDESNAMHQHLQHSQSVWRIHYVLFYVRAGACQCKCSAHISALSCSMQSFASVYVASVFNMYISRSPTMIFLISCYCRLEDFFLAHVV